MGKRLSREYFEDIYAQSTDPWDFETSLYERDKYKRTLEVLAHKQYHRALEVGCSIGVFTVMLAPLCAELVAVDIAEKAVVATRERVANFPNVRVERRTLPEETPEGPFDLIVASEVLYYLPKDMVLVALQRFEHILAPGGVFLAVHARGGWKTRIASKIKPLFLRYWVLISLRGWVLKNSPLEGNAVHELLLKHTCLTHAVSVTEPRYRLDLFEKN
jgi:cyclopropane fatty-acyl-phospholipid synthase-like methyltransferase